MDIINKAKELGALIQKDEKFIAFAKAKLASDKDENLQNKIGDFNIIRMNLENETAKADRDEQKIAQLNKDLRQAYDEIMAIKPMQDYNKAKSELDKMLNDVYTVLQAAASGEDMENYEIPKSTCTGVCENCSGCH